MANLILSDLREIKTVLDIPQTDSTQDAKLLLYAEWASDIINTYLGRPFNGINYLTRTQYYDGTGTQRLLLRNRPVNPSPTGDYEDLQVWVHEGGNFGTSDDAFSGDPKVYGTDYTLQIDQDDGTSRCGILIRLGNYWPKPIMRQVGLLSPFVGQDVGSIKVIYTAGWSVDTLPAAFRMANNLIIAQLRDMFPLGRWLTGESYEERSVSYWMRDFWDILTAILGPYRNWKW
ncbi:hypothetical protein C4577_07615 [Candidatus Parcubacteria bacterium]|nr:MAG: hypothetical protein C4577_07615 [Candidatus Parcubacteria bacterium]